MSRLSVEDLISPVGYIGRVERGSRRVLEGKEDEGLKFRGNLAFRKFDNTYTVQFNNLVRRFGHNDVEKIDYENMTQIKKKPKLGLRGEQLEPNI